VDGVLPICIGKATKIVENLHEANKVYQGEITLGFSTETEDAHGNVVSTTPIENPFSIQEIDKIMQQFIGEITQIPPMYSAVKVNGKRLYEYARAGEDVERPVRKAMIYDFRRISEPVYNEETKTQSWKFEVSCSKGTYVRTLSVDLGKALGVEAHMSQLTRIKSGPFHTEDCITLDELNELVQNNKAQEALKPVDLVFEDYPRMDLTKDDFIRFKNGAILSQTEFPQIVVPTACYYEDELLTIYGPHPTKKGLLKPIKMF
jgi:tRNA pseudouridine synthase B